MNMLSRLRAWFRRGAAKAAPAPWTMPLVPSMPLRLNGRTLYPGRVYDVPGLNALAWHRAGKAKVQVPVISIPNAERADPADFYDL